MKRTTPRHKKPIPREKIPFECIALVLQGGGALGSYQAGVYQALDEAKVYPDWVAGISIGAINAAIIVGNAPDKRVEKLREFWETITENPFFERANTFADLYLKGDLARGIFNKISAAYTLLAGTANFFVPRHATPFLHPDGTTEATSFYDTTILKSTLEKYVDFDRINHGKERISLGAVNVRSGNFVYFDNETHDITPEHVMASGSLPPGFAATEIEGEFYWDGGLVSNTPLQWVVDSNTRLDSLVFQVDLWNAEGSLPHNLTEVMTRQKEIQYSSRTRAATNHFKQLQRARAAVSNLIEKLPAELLNDYDVKLLKKVADHKVYNIIHLIYHAQQYEGHSKDYEFSRLSMQDHWQAGYFDAKHTLAHPQIFKRPKNPEGVFIFDVARDGNV
ncbi:MAG: patatin-like phospholipase family protein [Legionella sp.]|uniref:patatin-like phospholipase family protein n=1 Tax=Legionella sp. TaxID=459 RepID=UPI0039E5E5CA